MRIKDTLNGYSESLKFLVVKLYYSVYPDSEVSTFYFASTCVSIEPMPQYTYNFSVS
jgi:hypothetical protein